MFIFDNLTSSERFSIHSLLGNFLFIFWKTKNKTTTPPKKNQKNKNKTTFIPFISINIWDTCCTVFDLCFLWLQLVDIYQYANIIELFPGV